MLYVGAVYDDELDAASQRYVRPTTILWMRERALSERTTDAEREAFYTKSVGHRASAAVTELMASWDIHAAPIYEANSRETIRDEVLRRWLDEGSVRQRSGVAKNASTPTWVLSTPFASLFDPSLTGSDLVDAIDNWVATELSASAKIRLIGRRERQESEHAVIVELPNGVRRKLEAGPASLIVKGVVERWAAQRLTLPLVLAISEPGTKSALVDAALMSRVGITIDAANLLPDLLIADADAEPVEIWVIEIVHSDGEINETRKRELIAWAAQYNIAANQMRFLTAFSSRASGPARKRLKDLASDTYAWYADEPDQELYFGPLEQRAEPNLAVVTPISKSHG